MDPYYVVDQKGENMVAARKGEEAVIVIVMLIVVIRRDWIGNEEIGSSR